MKSLACVLALSFAASPALAAPKAASSKQACIAAHEHAQQLKSDKKPHAARAEFVTCAKPECPVVVRKECTEQLDAMDATAPTVTLEALDDKGNTDAAVKVTLDGQVVADRLTGAAIDVEPGDHAFVFERASDGKKLEQKVLVVEGEKNRKVTADYQTLLPKPVAPPPPVVASPKKVPILAYVAGGVAVAALGSFAAFSIIGRSKESDLAGTSGCRPSCSDDQVSPVKRDYLIGDISLGVAIVSVAVAAILAIPALTSSSPKTAAALGPTPWMPRVRWVR